MPGILSSQLVKLESPHTLIRVLLRLPESCSWILHSGAHILQNFEEVFFYEDTGSWKWISLPG